METSVHGTLPAMVRLRIHDDLSSIDRDAWNGLLARQAHPTPFLRHEYLSALHASGSAVADTGWGASFLTLWRGDALQAGCALYLKGHSYGEYVFDGAWGNAYERHGLAYYPKLLAAVPFTPVPGSRLLAVDDAARAQLLQQITTLAREHRLSSVHLLFGDEHDIAAAQAQGWMKRSGVQFHWQNRAQTPYRDFAEFLAGLQRDKRKKIQQERRRVGESGILFQVLKGAQIDESAWDFFYRCYTSTYREHGSRPYLTRRFFMQVAAEMSQHWLLFIAEHDGRRIAASLIALDPERRHAFGRYWGALEHVPLLHFEACYYQPLQWCIEHQWCRFEGGAQGEHKMARGLLPVVTHSAHWLAHPQFAGAVADFLAREGVGLDAYVDELRERTPFKAA